MDTAQSSQAGVARVLACPHCALPLLLSAEGATCGNRHSFDRARGGYLNLTVAGRLSAATMPGDTPDALLARRRFLAGGHYAPIAAALAEAIGAAEGPVFDVGCGEGYYLSQLPHPDHGSMQLFGLDVAKSAVQMAARLLPHAQFVVASAYRLPVLDASVAALFSVFAPHPFGEFERVLRPGGRWVTVTPGPAHLDEMRPHLQGDSQRKARERGQRRAEQPPEAHYATRVRFQLELTAEAWRDLFHMTPIRWQKGAQAQAQEGHTVSVDVWVSTWERR